MTIVSVGGIDFDCEWRVEEFDNGDTYPVLEGVSVGGVDITDIIDGRWWDKVQDELVKVLERQARDDDYGIDLDRNEAWGV